MLLHLYNISHKTIAISFPEVIFIIYCSSSITDAFGLECAWYLCGLMLLVRETVCVCVRGCERDRKRETERDREGQRGTGREREREQTSEREIERKRERR